MKQLTAFLKKEWIESIRTGKLLILLIVFSVFGIMNPAIAVLTPTLFDMMSDTLAKQGIAVQEMTVDAMTSWEQYYKNAGMYLIVMVIMLSGILTSEYQRGTLINMLTKGLARWKVIVSKMLAAMFLWTISYLLCFLFTYGYTAFFWNNSIAKHVGIAALLVYIFGIWLISLILLASSLFQSNFSVLLMTGGCTAVSYMIGMVPKVAKYLPTQLMNAGSLLNGTIQMCAFAWSLVIVGILICLNLLLSVVIFNRKML